MLTSLQIRNYAIIEELSVSFGRGLNIITGETGAGKSILIDALGLILGNRAESDAVRHGTDRAIVEAVFDVAGNTGISALLTAHDIDSGNELILRREVSAKGQSRCFINDSPAPIAVLKEIGDALVDLHGQHEHQSLLRVDSHRRLLDDVGGLAGLVEEYHAAYGHVMSVVREIDELSAREQELGSKRALFEFQMKEIDAVAPLDGEEQQLETELNILENAERLHAATERLHAMLYEGEQAVHDQLVLARNMLDDLASIDPAFGEYTAEAASATAIVGELAKFLQKYNSGIEFNPERLESIRERLGQLTLLKKKYGGSIGAVMALREQIGREFALAENFQAELETLEQKYRQSRTACSRLAERLSAKRLDVAAKVGRSIEKSLEELGIRNAKFETRVEQVPAPATQHPIVKLGKEAYQAGPAGIDTVEFYLSTNAGEEVKPLAKVASGGEVSRVMLAMKMILARSERLPLLIFDEIDVGVSGRIAQSVGKAMKELSRLHQVIAITHLPQIAGLADAHIVVEKEEQGGRARTTLRTLSLDERVHEVARLMSGIEVTAAGIRGAKELMGLR